jgi:D-alanine transfer protein
MLPKPQLIGNSDKTSRIHLFPATLALLIFVITALAGNFIATSIENLYVHALAPFILAQTISGSALQQAAFRQPDLLPIYGSSEMLAKGTPFRTNKFFSSYPSGFNVFIVAKVGNASLDIAQNLAAVGPDLRGKKVIISFTPSMFINDEVSKEAYAGNFSDLHANALIFNPGLNRTLKQHAALRMLQYPDTLSNDPILTFALKRLANNTFLDTVLYDAVFPLGRLHIFILRMQDHFEVLNFLRKHHPNPRFFHQPHEINWNEGLPPLIPNQNFNPPNNTNGNLYENGSLCPEDQKYLETISKSKEWEDLRMVLDILKQEHAQPLIMTRPINGSLYASKGITAMGQQAYYNKLRELVGLYDMPLIDFHEYTNDSSFSSDEFSHSNEKGWLIVNQTIDAFFHGKIHY